VPVGVHAYSVDEAAGYDAEGATIVTVVVDAVVSAKVIRHHRGIACG
jgi:4-hydroxy-2-oxoheptanedioate aldolase